MVEGEICWDARLNRVVVELTPLDEATTAFCRDAIPEDALLLRCVGPVRNVAL